MIKSISYDQDEILNNILILNSIDNFDIDVTYGNGGFYKHIPQPSVKLDLEPLFDDVMMVDSCNLSMFKDLQFKSLVFDPPFLTYIKKGRSHNSIMGRRFGGYWRYDELANHYKKTINESHRVLSSKGIMIFKCQDIIHNHKMHSTHMNVVNWCEGLFRLKDMFILCAKSRMPMPGHKLKTQRHARVSHSYFLVLEKS